MSDEQVITLVKINDQEATIISTSIEETVQVIASDEALPINIEVIEERLRNEGQNNGII